mmetsp:Transcript_15319/g.36160  ORF Transcript_15319/g.36160 Transcript_15319/m.36160 type:complete len:330 (-) Transcript_15319:37-1026(-)
MQLNPDLVVLLFCYVLVCLWGVVGAVHIAARGSGHAAVQRSIQFTAGYFLIVACYAGCRTGWLVLEMFDQSERGTFRFSFGVWFCDAFGSWGFFFAKTLLIFFWAYLYVVLKTGEPDNHQLRRQLLIAALLINLILLVLLVASAAWVVESLQTGVDTVQAASAWDILLAAYSAVGACGFGFFGFRLISLYSDRLSATDVESGSIKHMSTLAVVAVVSGVSFALRAITRTLLAFTWFTDLWSEHQYEYWLIQRIFVELIPSYLILAGLHHRALSMTNLPRRTLRESIALSSAQQLVERDSRPYRQLLHSDGTAEFKLQLGKRDTMSQSSF